MAEENTNLTDEQLQQQVTQQAGLDTEKAPELPTGTEVTPTLLTEEPSQILEAPTKLEQPNVALKEASEANLEIPVPVSDSTATYSAYVNPNSPEALAAQGTLNSQAIIGNIQGAVSKEAEKVTEELNPKATVQYQLGELYKALDNQSGLPAWAAPAVRKVSALMAQRGLGASSMAGAAITQAIYESAIPIAANDAKAYANIQLKNLDNAQKATLQNAVIYAAMDKANLDARLSAAVNNARNFLSIDISNLNNQQKTNELNFQGKLQTLFNNQAQENAARQFNAKSQNEVEMFFAELGVQAENANKNRIAATRQFNADQSNAQSRFVASLQDSREKFNQNMQLQIDQSNVTWRRNINTANTAVQNETNRLNALNLLQINQSALNNLWQRYRDEASWSLQISENANQRAHQVAMFAQESTFNKEMYDEQTKDLTQAEVGRAVLKGIFNMF